MPNPPPLAAMLRNCAAWVASLLGLSFHGTSALAAAPEFCEPRSWAVPEQFPAGSDLTAADFAWTVKSTKQRIADDLRSVDSRREMQAVRQAIWVVRFSWDALANRRKAEGTQDERDERQVGYSTAEGHTRGMAFRDEYSREMAPGFCFHNWNLVTNEQLEVDVLRRPDRLAPWSDLIRMRFVRQGKDWKFDDAEWLNRRIEPADVAPK